MESFEKSPKIHTENEQTLASKFNELTPNTNESLVFRELEEILINKGYEPGDNNHVSEILHDNSLMCRSENFSKVIELVEEDSAIELPNERHDANMCTMSSASGYKTAMTEGFSGADVGNKVKVVISFHGDHISQSPIPKDSDLWQLKPQTAEVSVSGEGEIQKEDIEMISLRFPVHYFPEKLLTEDEKDDLEEQDIHFIVRHYIKKKSIH